jgi:hypothetical protein
VYTLYDVSLVDGFNLPISVMPQDGSRECKAASCPHDVKLWTKFVLQISVHGLNGSVIALMSACLALNQLE